MHPPLRGRPQIFNLHFSSTYSRCLIPLHQPSSSSSLPPAFRKGPRLNSQRPHPEESVNAKREKGKGENVEPPRIPLRDSSKSFSSRRNSNFVAFTWANLRAEARQTEWDVGIIHFDNGDVNFYQFAVIYSEKKSFRVNFNQRSVLISDNLWSF